MSAYRRVVDQLCRDAFTLYWREGGEDAFLEYYGTRIGEMVVKEYQPRSREEGEFILAVLFEISALTRPPRTPPAG